MARRSLTCVPDHKLLHQLADLVSQDRSMTAELLEHIAEVDARKLYVPAAHPTMYRYCLDELHMSEDEAARRIRAARTARDFPIIFEMVADGRLHMTAVLLLAPVLDSSNAAGLLTAAANKTKAEIERLLAESFPKQDVETSLKPVPVASVVENAASERPSPAEDSLALGVANACAQSPALERVVPSGGTTSRSIEVPLSPRPRIAPLAPERFSLQVTLTKSTHDKLRRAQELLSHALPSGEIAQVLDRALDELISKLEKRRFAATKRPGKPRRSKSARHVPAHVRRAVSERDRYQCTFMSEGGRRCTERRFLEYDHVDPVARGGEATIENTRLRCRAHNQYEAERIYGAGFMREKRGAARGSAGSSGS